VSATWRGSVDVSGGHGASSACGVVLMVLGGDVIENGDVWRDVASLSG